MGVIKKQTMGYRLPTVHHFSRTRVRRPGHDSTNPSCRNGFCELLHYFPRFQEPGSVATQLPDIVLIRYRNSVAPLLFIGHTSPTATTQNLQDASAVAPPSWGFPS